MLFGVGSTKVLILAGGMMVFEDTSMRARMLLLSRSRLKVELHNTADLEGKRRARSEITWAFSLAAVVGRVLSFLIRCVAAQLDGRFAIRHAWENDWRKMSDTIQRLDMCIRMLQPSILMLRYELRGILWEGLWVRCWVKRMDYRLSPSWRLPRRCVLVD